MGFHFDRSAKARYSPAPHDSLSRKESVRDQLVPTEKTNFLAQGGAKLPTDRRKKVLIVDSSDSREVLRTALRMRGVDTAEAERSADGLAMVDEYAPDLIVLDVETLEEEAAMSNESFDRQRSSAPMVILGTVQRNRKPLSNHPDTEFVSKPYHFAPLIRKIESLLQQSPADGSSKNTPDTEFHQTTSLDGKRKAA